MSLEKNPEVSEKLLIIFFVSVLEDDITSLQAATSIQNILITVKKYFSFCNFEVIEDLVKKFGNKDDKHKLKKYKASFTKFIFTLCNNRVLKLGHHIRGRDQITLKLMNDDEKLSGDTVRKIKQRVCKILGIHRTLLYLCKIREGCFECDFSVSNSISKCILELKSETRIDSFKEDHITVIDVFCSSSKVWCYNITNIIIPSLPQLNVSLYHKSSINMEVLISLSYSTARNTVLLCVFVLSACHFDELLCV